MAEEPVKTRHSPGGGEVPARDAALLRRTREHGAGVDTFAVRLARSIDVRATAVDGVA